MGDLKGFLKFSLLGVIPAMIVGLFILHFVNSRFSNGPLAPVGRAAGWAAREAGG